VAGPGSVLQLRRGGLPVLPLDAALPGDLHTHAATRHNARVCACARGCHLLSDRDGGARAHARRQSDAELANIDVEIAQQQARMEAIDAGETQRVLWLCFTGAGGDNGIAKM
jgi:hypothetical protein